jgi:import inner membrane translocase subunit TIM23
MSSDNTNAADYLRTAQFTTASTSSSPSISPEVPTASDVLAGGGGGAFDPSRLHPLAGLTDKLEYLTLEDEKTNELPGARTALPSRGWGDDLCYGTGTTYLSGES